MTRSTPASNPILIGLVSHAPRSGKSSIAQILEDKYNAITEPFAAPLKELALEALVKTGVCAEKAEYYVYEAKEEVIPKLGVTARHMLQTLGTEWGRRKINSNLWLMCWEGSYRDLAKACGIAQQLAQGGDFLPQPTPLLVIVDDVRFPNEADLIRSMGGQVWEVIRPGTDLYVPLPEWLTWAVRLIPKRWRSRFHASEGRLRKYPHFNRTIINDGTLKDLESVIDGIARGGFRPLPSVPGYNKNYFCALNTHGPCKKV